jgi:hypothetical protein
MVLKIYISKNNITYGGHYAHNTKFLAFSSNNVLKNVRLDFGNACDIFFEKLNWYE